ncbi:Lar family restriction alleviation protein [Leptolyngbya sp. AN03gr2]|uniref:Lar family restriction alleviation protein n=1 Tax=unclassified Leptolyngbya TaxID=2650499 RepID=UPI003D31A3F0
MAQFQAIDQFSLLPCPFCGGVDLEFFESLCDTDEFGYGVEVCCVCGASGAAGATEAIAAQRWNQRVPDSKPHSKGKDLLKLATGWAGDDLRSCIEAVEQNKSESEF